MNEAPAAHKRRVRYAGGILRRLKEKYKELDPTRHADEVHEVMQRGQAPAGMQADQRAGDPGHPEAPSRRGRPGCDARLRYDA